MTIEARAVAALRAAPALAGARLQGVWLFGSVARGEERETSDVDLGLLCAPELGPSRAALMDQLGRALGRDVDVVDLRSAPPSLVWEILTTGRILAEDDDAAVEQFVRAARFAAEDDEQRARMVLLAQVGGVGGASR